MRCACEKCCGGDQKQNCKYSKKIPKVKQPMKGFGFRADEQKMKLAQSSGIDVNELFRRSLDQALMRETGKCPTCGAERNMERMANIMRKTK